MSDTGSPIKILVGKPWFWVVFILLAFSVPLIRTVMKQQQMPHYPVLGQASEFSFTNQDGKTVTHKDLQGKISIINFIFTSCPETCPFLTQQMAQIQKHMTYVREFVRLVSVTVDPKVDTPQVLKHYAAKFKANHKMWHFLTGSLQDIKTFAVDGLKVGMDSHGEHGSHGNHGAHTDEMDNLMPIVHAEHFVILDQAGQIRAYRQAKNDKDIEKIVHDVTILVNSLPQHNQQQLDYTR